MSFQIFASGTTQRTRHFHYRRSGLDVGDIYDMVGALQGITAVPASARVWQEGVRAGGRALAIDQAQERASATSAHQRGMEAETRQIGAHIMSTNLTNMLMTRIPLILHVAVRASGRGGNVVIRFDSSEVNAPARFLRHANPVLSAAGMNGFGVLHALALVFSGYDAVAGTGTDGLFRLLVQIDG